MDYIADCCASHMGEWNTDKRSKDELPLPETKGQMIVHLADYLASRLFLRVSFDVSEVDELMKEKEKYSKESMEIIKRSNEELREFKHDLKNYLLPLQEAMETMPQSEMAKVWEKINQKIEGVQTLIQTGNSYVDSMINTKITLARSEKVDVKCTILSKMEGIDDLEFCSVFGNLMDNAIEAERKVTEKKEIIIFVEEKMGYLRLEIQNKIEKSVLNENSSLNTTKKDTSSHGIGHKSVKRTMQKVGGALKYYETGDLFCAEAVFPIK